MNMDEELLAAFKRQYHYVIGEDLKPTGHGHRVATKELISICDAIDPGVEHGNLNSGMMDVDKINELAQKLDVI